MTDQPSREPQASDSSSTQSEPSSEISNRQVSNRRTSVRQASDASEGVDDEIKRRLEEAYLNDAEDVLVVTAVRSVADGGAVVVEFRTPHGEATHTERFDAPTHGSLAECADLLRFLEVAGVSPLDLDDLVGTRVPATFDPETGWRVDSAYVSPEDESKPGVRSRVDGAWRGSIGWLRTYRDWLIVILLVGFELLLVVVLILLFA